MAKMGGYPALLLVIVLGFVFEGSAPFEEKVADACHSLRECGRARLTCDAGQRLAILRVSHAHHPNSSAFAECPVSTDNCSTALASDCCFPPPEIRRLDCAESYPSGSGVLREAHENCSARMSPGGPVVCDLGLPPSPQPSLATCQRLDPFFQDASSYSSVNYTCVNETDVVPMCTASQQTGSLLYTLWTGGDGMPAPTTTTTNLTTPTPITPASCRCTVTPAVPGSAATLLIRTLDVRIRNSASSAAPSSVGDDCSYVIVSERGRTRLTTSCATDTELFFGMTSQSSGLTDITTPADVILTLSVTNPPDIVWFGIMGLDQENITVTCYEATSTSEQEKPRENDDDDDNGSAVTAAVTSAAVGVVILVLIGFVCCYLFRKQRKRSQTRRLHKRRVSKSWWERTREEDRIAELSQLGTASRVVVDTGRHMRYGREPVTKTYRTSDTNPPIYIVPGSAFQQPPPQPPPDAPFGSTSEGPDGDLQFDHRGYSSSGADHHRPEPLVFYSASAGSGQVVIVPPETLPPAKKYDIPPLTIRELED